jgi:GntR family transcriptional regulator
MNRVQPLYVQLKQRIRQSIADGRYAPGDRLLSQRDLVGEFGASHMTIRRVINELIQEGVIYAIPGKGLFVSEVRQDAESSPLVSFSTAMKARGMNPSSKILKAELISASAVLARVFGVDVGLTLVRLYRLRLADDAPIAVQDTYLLHSACPELLDFDLAKSSLYDILCSHYQLCLNRGIMSISAVLASDEYVSLLGTDFPAALLVTEQITYLESGEVIEFTRSAYRGDRYHMRI